ncbi:MAG: 4Fe-4S dicluster domain-containing protein [Candidatus Lokiarchaeota archaeon]|nr:4Fe-4S dicluster domain-containing protein [Candidatus Lokiarchaeota archaeon]MBD3341287.1 4Fe-4S dicluster domain-containing protein [Candidatus Lokiarchaeota archaeon]
MNRKLGFVIDQERCIGCDTCTVACRLEHDSPQGFIKVQSQIKGQKDVPLGDFPDLTLNFTPKLCNHCENPPCLEACPVSAIVKREDGIVLIDDELCEGCQSCVEACPYKVIIFNVDINVAQKCNLCAHRIDKGLDPFCVLCCEGQAIYFGDFNDPQSKVSKLALQDNLFQLHPEFGTNTSIYYSPPREKRPL